MQVGGDGGTQSFGEEASVEGEVQLVVSSGEKVCVTMCEGV